MYQFQSGQPPQQQQVVKEANPLPPLGPPPPPAPRDMPLGAIGWTTRFFLIFGLGFGGIPTVVGIVMMLSFGSPYDDFVLDQRGRQVDATPTGVSGTSVTVNDQPMMRIHLRFRDEDGDREKTSVTTLSPSLVRAAEEGETIPIEYDPEKPERARLLGDSVGMGPMVLMPLMFGVIGIPMFVWALFSALRQRSTYKNGTPAQARVVDLTRTGGKQNGRRVMCAHYEYSSPKGTLRGQLKTVDPPPLHAVIWVLYDPQRPERSIAAARS